MSTSYIVPPALKESKCIREQMVRRLKAQTTFPEGLSSIPSTHMAADNHLNLQFPGT